MENSNEIVEILKAWVKAWRDNNGVADGVVLSGENLEKFVGELQTEIVNVIGDFGENTIGENAKLVLYTGYGYDLVQEFCELSDGEYYMISQTAANALWDPDLQRAIANAIGESNATDPLTARVLFGRNFESDPINGG